MRMLNTIPADALLLRDAVRSYPLIHRSLVERIKRVKPAITGFNRSGIRGGFENVMQDDWKRAERDKQQGAAL